MCLTITLPLSARFAIHQTQKFVRYATPEPIAPLNASRLDDRSTNSSEKQRMIFLPAPNPHKKSASYFPLTENHHNLPGSNVNAAKPTRFHTEVQNSTKAQNSQSCYIGENALKMSLPIWKNVLRDYDLEHMVTVLYRDTFLVDGSSTNASVVVSTHGRLVFEWEKLRTTSTC